MKKVLLLTLIIWSRMFMWANPLAQADPIAINTLLLEARGEGQKGMQAVAEVIRTRSAERHLTFEQVCFQRLQFSCWNNKATAWKTLASLEKRKDYAELYRKAKQAWEDSATSNITSGSNLYHADYVHPDWDWSKAKRKVKIGQHIFYKEKRG